LLDAVIKYSEVIKTKIVVTELAEWARRNINGLEDVQAYHFTREIKEPKNGKKIKRLCTVRIEEINIARDTSVKERTNILISSVNIDRFYELDKEDQRKMIVEMRDILKEYKNTNRKLRYERDLFKETEKDIKDIKDKIEDCSKQIKGYLKKQKEIEKQIGFLMKKWEDVQTRQKLEEIGITDNDFNLLKFNDALKSGSSKLFNIEEEIIRYQQIIDEIDSNIPESDEVLEKLTDF